MAAICAPSKDTCKFLIAGEVISLSRLKAVLASSLPLPITRIEPLPIVAILRSTVVSKLLPQATA